MTAETWLCIASGVLLLLFAALGVRVARAPLGAFDALGAKLRGRGVRLAIVFTRSGRSRAVTVACAIAIAVYAFAHLPIVIPAVLIVSQIVSQTIVELIKQRYRRIRPEYWLDRLEAGHSYPSGHATTAVVFFLSWALIAASSTMPAAPKAIVCALIAGWACGISWSRLALGAHYLSDVLGGAIFGFAWLCALAAGLRVAVHAS